MIALVERFAPVCEQVNYCCRIIGIISIHKDKVSQLNQSMGAGRP